MKLLAFALIFLTQFTHCKPDTVETQVTTPMETRTYTYLALGDSYTIGQGVIEEERWPNQLSAELNGNGKEITNVNIIAQTGWTTTDLLNAIQSENPEKHDIVSLLIGVNNQYQNKPFNLFETEFDSLLNISINLASSIEKVFVVSIPDYGVTPFGANNSQQIAMELDQYNDYMEVKCSSMNIPFINITEISRQLGSSNGALASDNLHPSGYQYGLWVQEILPTVMNLLED